jgi:hypothetical protein
MLRIRRYIWQQGNVLGQQMTDESMISTDLPVLATVSVPEAEVLPPERAPGNSRGPLRGLRGKTPGSGRAKGTPNKGPKVAQILANKASPDAVRHLVKVMQFQRFAINDTWAWPTIHSATQAAMKILDIADMPAKEAALGALGTPVMVNINLGSSAPPAVTIDGQAVRIEAAE